MDWQRFFDAAENFAWFDVMADIGLGLFVLGLGLFVLISLVLAAIA